MSRLVLPPDYGVARQRFREAAARAGWSLEAHAIAARGPDGEALTVDVAASAPPGADRVLIVSSGIHGVEGPFGSAVQTAWLEDAARASTPPRPVRLVFVHALNPYGFAWSRRTDAANIDPNRNFVEDGHWPEAGASLYAAFDPLLNPRRPPSRWDPFYVRALWAAGVHGVPALKETLVAGQYAFPFGLFFGGQRPSETRLLVERHLEGWVGGARHVLHLDLHTGLGRWGRGKLLIDYPLTAAQRDRLRRWFGPETIEEGDPRGVAYRARGSLGPWCVARGVAPDYLFAFAEFGTYGQLRVLAGLRAENQAHHWAAASSAATARAKARLRRLFCPADERWQNQALAGARGLIERALDGLMMANHGS